MCKYALAGCQNTDYCINSQDSLRKLLHKKGHNFGQLLTKKRCEFQGMLERLKKPLILEPVKTFLDAELAKYGTWKEFRSNKSIRPIIETEPMFRSVKGKGVGQTTILKFLGGNRKHGRHLVNPPSAYSSQSLPPYLIELLGTKTLINLSGSYQFNETIRPKDI